MCLKINEKKSVRKFSCNQIIIITFSIVIICIFADIFYMHRVDMQDQKIDFEIIEHSTIFLPNSVPYEQCHASTLCKLQDGTLICAWYGGSMEGAQDVAIWASRKEEGKNWIEPLKIADAENIPCWNPVLFYNGQKIFLFYKVGQSPVNW